MDKKQKLEMIQKLSEKDFTKQFLIPLYESDGMDCKNVQFTHKHLEFGKDVIYYKDDEYEKRVYTAVQVKKTKITTGDVAEIVRQIYEAFGEKFNDSSDNKKKDIDKFVLLTSNEILEDAKQSLSAVIRENRRDVTYIEGKQLVGLLDKHLPSAFWDEYDYFNKYFNAMKTDFETIKDISAIGQKEFVPLENIYVSLKLSEKTIEREIPIEKEWKIFEEKNREGEVEKRIEKERVIHAEKAIQDYDKLVIVGVPGSGKTTLLKYFALKTCKENLEKQERICVPIPIVLRSLLESEKSLREYIDEVFKKYKFDKATEFVESDLKEGKCRLLLDGFDELATKENQDKITEQIYKFTQKYRKCQIVVTSRTAGYHDELKGFTKLELMEFDDEQIKKFILNWFGENDPDRANSMFNAIKENEQIKALARNPLMIAIIAIIYEEDQKLPQKRAALYERCVEVLLSKWDVQKRLKNVYPSDKKKFILRKLAFYGHKNNKRVMSEKEVMQEMLKYFPQIQLKKEDAKPFLDEIWRRSYLLRQIAIDSYDFLHLSFQEYFTALELKEREDGISTIINHLQESWWEEPTLLYAGISKDATTLINRIEKEVPEDMFYSNLMLFGKCVVNAVFTKPATHKKIVDKLWSIYKTAEFSSLRKKAIEMLAFIKPENIINTLIKDLEDKERSVPFSAAYTLGEIGSEKAVDLLIKLLATNKDSDVRWCAAYALRNIRSEKTVEELIKLLKTSKENDVRGNAAITLGCIGDEKAIKPLISLLTTDKDSYVRANAVYALGSIESKNVVGRLIKLLATDKDSDVRWCAAYALGKIGSKKAIDPLIQILKADESYSVQWYAANSLGIIGSEIAIEPLISFLNSKKNGYIRGKVAEALGSIGSDKVIGPLIKVITTDKEHAVRSYATAALGNFRSEKIVELLIKLLMIDKEGNVRWNAAKALGSIGSEKAIEPLIKTLTTDKYSDVRRKAADALGSIGDKRAIEPLKRALKDEGSFSLGKVKDGAFDALEKISRRMNIRIEK